MGAQAISNANLLNLSEQGVTGFAPALTYAVAGNNVTITDASVIPAGDALKKVHIRLHDQFGGEVRDVITVTGAPGQKVLSSATLNKSMPLKITATVITNENRVADGTAIDIGAAGSVGYWDIQKNAKA